MKRLYYDIKNPSSLSGERKLLRAAALINPQIILRDVKEFLSEQDAHTLHKITRKKFPRRKILAPKPKVIVAADLADMRNLAKYNNGYKYIVVFIDVFSRYLRAVSIKKKNAEVLRNVIKEVLESNDFKGASRLFVDRGGEFYNRMVEAYCRDNNIKIYSVFSYDVKSAIAERVIQTLKRKIYKYLSANNKRKYISALPELVNTYNKTIHCSLGGKTPAQVHNLKSPKAITRQFYVMYKTAFPSQQSRSTFLSVGDSVRIVKKVKGDVFKRGYTVQTTEEIFTIIEIDRSQNPAIFYLKDLGGEKIDGIFYESELVRTAIPEHFPIRILRRRKNKYLVRWQGYPPNFDSWVNVRDLRVLQAPSS